MRSMITRSTIPHALCQTGPPQPTTAAMPAIRHIESGFYRLPLPQALTDSIHGEMRAFELNTVRVRDEDGVEGVGYTFTCGRNGAAIDAVLRRAFPELLQGEDA